MLDMTGFNDVLLKLLLALLLGGIVGFEREAEGRAAGLRTHILVSVGSCLIMLTSLHIFDIYQGVAACDPGRIAAGVVTGIGFLGAGTILRYRASVIGLTTAASLWAVAAVGLAVGSGFYAGGIVATLLIISTLEIVSKLEYKIIRRHWYKTLELHIGSIDENLLQKIRDILAFHNVQIRDFEVEKITDRKESILRLDIKLTTKRANDNIIIELLKLDEVSKAQWQ